jgi:hypothetical protein
MLAFDTGLAPAVGQQVSATPATFNDQDVVDRVQLLRGQADAGACALIVKGTFGGEPRGAVYIGGDQWRSDRIAEPLVSTNFILTAAATPGQESTFTCVPPGAGARMGVDRDQDGFFDQDEIDAGTNPADPTSFLGAPPVATIQTTKLTLKDDSVEPISLKKRKISFTSRTNLDPPANRIVPPAPGSDGDPTLHGARLRVYNANGSGEQISVDLNPADWMPLGTSGYSYKGPDSENGPVKSARIITDRITLKGGKSLWPYTLNEPSQGRIAVRLTLGTGIDWCAEAPAKASGNPPSTARNDKVDKFLAAKKTPAPASCPQPPIGSPGGAFLDGDAALF